MADEAAHVDHDVVKTDAKVARELVVPRREDAIEPVALRRAVLDEPDRLNELVEHVHPLVPRCEDKAVKANAAAHEEVVERERHEQDGESRERGPAEESSKRVSTRTG